MILFALRRNQFKFAFKFLKRIQPLNENDDSRQISSDF
jgi:hypothetical protein